MRLLHIEANGDFSLVEHVGNNIPPYAILSHTWGEDHDEVTFKDLMEGMDRGTNRAGYRKLTFCGKQAAKDNLQHFWVDTCCIDKSSSAELSEAIHSMFRWYHNATKCYVYLSDVSLSSSVGNDSSSHQAWNLAFRHSRWFTRGWTLQELIAPAYTEFFSAEGKRLGDKCSMIQEIHDITGISIRALEGSPLSQFSVDERMAWARGRETKREEDAAYSLLGLFNIHMPLIYGEGGEKAFARLQREIEDSHDIQKLVRRNQEILLETQRVVLRQHYVMESSSVTATSQFIIIKIMLPFLTTALIFAIPEPFGGFHRTGATFVACLVVFTIMIHFGVWIARGASRNTPPSPSEVKSSRSHTIRLIS